MEFLHYLIVILGVYFVFLTAQHENKKAQKNFNDDGYIIRLPKIYFWGGMIGFLVCLGLYIMMLVIEEETPAWVGFILLGFIVIIIAFITFCIKWKIVVYKETFVYTTMFGRSYEINYTDVKEVNLSQYSLTITTAQKTFHVDKYAIGLELIMRKFKENGIRISRPPQVLKS